MSIFGKNRDTAQKTMIVYAGALGFCVVFTLVYYCFSHGVHSPYMTWLWGFPFVLGVLPFAFLWRYPSVRRPGWLASRFYHSGVAALTVSSMLRGIFEIAGNSSVYQEYLMTAGAGMVAAALVVYMAGGGSLSGKRGKGE